MQEALSGLTKKNEFLNILFDFDSKNANNSKISYYCDKLEADLQFKTYADNGLHRILNNQKNNRVFNSSKIQDIVKNGARTTFDIWYLLDYPIYKKI